MRQTYSIKKYIIADNQKYTSHKKYVFLLPNDINTYKNGPIA